MIKQFIVYIGCDYTGEIRSVKTHVTFDFSRQALKTSISEWLSEMENTYKCKSLLEDIDPDRLFNYLDENFDDLIEEIKDLISKAVELIGAERFGWENSNTFWFELFVNPHYSKDDDQPLMLFLKSYVIIKNLINECLGFTLYYLLTKLDSSIDGQKDVFDPSVN